MAFFIVYIKANGKSLFFEKSILSVKSFIFVIISFQKNNVIGITVPENIVQDGVNLLPSVASKDTLSVLHQALFWRVGYVKVVRKGDWKLHLNEKEGLTFLHNLKDDPLETRNLATKQPEKVSELKK
jgi:arylsulfatase A-like enzyme